MEWKTISRRSFITAMSAAALGTMGLTLAACGGATTTPAAPTTAGAAPTTAPAAGNAAPTTAPEKAGAAANWLVRSDPAENNGQERVFEPAIKAKYPDLKLNRIVVPSPEYIVKINTMGAAKESLEVFGFGQNYYDFWARRLVEPIDQFITADKWDVDNYFQPGLMDIFKVHGKHYGLSQLTTFGQCIAYNKDLLDQAGLKPPPADWNDKSWTYDALLDMAKKLTKNYGKPDGQYGVNLDQDNMTDLAWIEGMDNFLPEHYQNAIAPKTTFNNPGNITGHQRRHDWIYKEKAMPDPALTQGLNQLGNPFKSSKVAMNITGGWQYWNTADLTAFKYGFAALPYAKTNKDHNYDDFWEMGSWSSNKETAWKVMRVLTDVPVVNDYSALSHTPPTPRASLDPWLQGIAKATGMSIDDLKKVTTGAIDPSHSQESADHLFLQHPKIHDTYDQDSQPFWADASLTAEKVIPDIAKKMDDVVGAVYNQFKDTIPKD
jgi:multiple sugar transport system substrate-binding protein